MFRVYVVMVTSIKDAAAIILPVVVLILKRLSLLPPAIPYCRLPVSLASMVATSALNGRFLGTLRSSYVNKKYGGLFWSPVTVIITVVLADWLLTIRSDAVIVKEKVDPSLDRLLLRYKTPHRGSSINVLRILEGVFVAYW